MDTIEELYGDEAKEYTPTNFFRTEKLIKEVRRPFG